MFLIEQTGPVAIDLNYLLTTLLHNCINRIISGEIMVRIVLLTVDAIRFFVIFSL